MEIFTEKKVISFFQQFIPGIEALYLFGSQVDGTANDKSDYDFAFLVQEKPQANNGFMLKAHLAQLLNSDIDIIDFLRADTVTQAQIVAFGSRIFAQSDRAMSFLETSILSKYAQLNEERRGIVTSIVKEGTIYGR